MLIEVIVSALLVAVIVIATFTGFDSINSGTAEQRRQDQAAIVAAQSQEALRSDPSTALSALEITPHTYTEKVGGTTYTVTQTAKYVNNSSGEAGCSISGASEGTHNQSSDYLAITSSVTWSGLSKAKRPAVQQTSIITPPTGSALEFDATNGASPELPVAGVTAIVKYTAVESSTPTTVEGTTGAAGCLVFGGIPSTSAQLELKAAAGLVTPSGAFKVAPQEVTIAPNITVTKTQKFAEGGTVTAEFTHEGKSVPGETFVISNTSMIVSPEFLLGDTAFSYESGGEEKYTPLTNKPATSATTASHTNYPTGDAFPFTGSWLVYAGDCLKNSPESPGSVRVEAGHNSTVKVPLSAVALSVWKGTKTTPEPITGEALPVRIVNTKCVGTSPADNATATVTTHEQKLSGGHLEDPYQPFGAFTLCVYSAAQNKNYLINYTNTTEAGSTANIYLKGSTEGEQTVTNNPSEKC